MRTLCFCLCLFERNKIFKDFYCFYCWVDPKIWKKRRSTHILKRGLLRSTKNVHFLVFWTFYRTETTKNSRRISFLNEMALCDIKKAIFHKNTSKKLTRKMGKKRFSFKFLPVTFFTWTFPQFSCWRIYGKNAVI